MVNLNAAAQRAYALAVGTSTGALKAFRIALVTTGIGAFVVALGLAAEAMGLFSSKTEDEVENQEDIKRALDETVGTLEFYERKLKAFGTTDEQLAAIRIKRYEQERDNIQKNLDEAIRAEGIKYNTYQNAARQELEVLKVKIKEEQNIIDKFNNDRAAADAAARAKRLEERRREFDQERQAVAAKQRELDGIIAESRQALLESSLSANERELEQIDASYEERIAKVKGNEEATNLLLTQLRAERTAKIQEQQDAADQAQLDAQRAQLDYQIQIEDELYAEREKLRQEDLQREKAYNDWFRNGENFI